MQLSSKVIGLVERAYEVDADAADWLDTIRDAAQASFRGQMTAQAVTFHVSPDTGFRCSALASDDPVWEVAFEQAHANATPDVIRKLYTGSPVKSVYHALLGQQDDPGYQACVQNGIRDITLALGLDPSGHGCGLSFLHREVLRIPRATRHALERVSAHLAAAHRLRRATDEYGSPTQAPLDEAFLRPDGKLLDAESPATDPQSRAALRDAARRIDRARTRRGRADPDHALAMWRALVDGRWSLVERFESDGRRLLVARRNPPTAQHLGALDDRERRVVSLLVLGHSIKLCAYELGRAENTVSEIAKRALAKLGLRTRAELIELYGALVPADSNDPCP